MIFLMPNLKTSLKLILPLFLVWLWTNQPSLTPYHFRLAIAILIFYLLFRLMSGQKPSLMIEVTVLSAALLLILAATGGLNSPFFFLIYFLLFAVAAMTIFATTPTVIYTLALVFFWIKDLHSLADALQILSLLLFSTLALYFSKQRLNLLKSQREIKALEKEATSHRDGLLKIIHLTSEILADNRLPLGKTGRDHLQAIYKTAKELLEEK